MANVRMMNAPAAENGTARAPVVSPAEPSESARKPPPPRRNTRAMRRQFRSLVVALGPRVLDRRTTLGKSLAAWRDDLERDLGGDVSTQQRAVIDLAVRTKLLLESIDSWLLVQPSLINARKRALLPAVRERQGLADALARYLGQLGLERRAKPATDLAALLANTATTVPPRTAAQPPAPVAPTPEPSAEPEGLP